MSPGVEQIPFNRKDVAVLERRVTSKGCISKIGSIGLRFKIKIIEH